MSDTEDPKESTPPNLEALAKTYMDLWQQHLNALAGDGDTNETLARTMAMMGSNAQAFADAAAGAASNDQATSSPAPTSAASSGGDPRSDGLHGRVTSLEERIARLESKLADLRRKRDGGDK